MWPQVSHRWCEVSQRIGAPQLSQGASPPRVGWHCGPGVRAGEVAASVTPSRYRRVAPVRGRPARRHRA